MTTTEQTAKFIRTEDEKVVAVTANVTPGGFLDLIWQHYTYPAYVRIA